MFNIVIGNCCYSRMVMTEFIELEQPTVYIGTREEIEQNKDLKVIKEEVDITDIRMVREIVKGQNVKNIYIMTGSDRLNLMLADALSSYGQIYTFFKDKRFMELINKECRALCLNTVIKDFILREDNKA